MDDHSPDRPDHRARVRQRPARRQRVRKPRLEALEERALLASALTTATGFGASVDLRTLGVATDSASNSYITGAFKGTLTIGTSTLTSVGDHDLFVAKLSSSGSVIWAESFKGSQWNCVSQGSAIAVDGSGNVYLTGEFSGSVDFDPGAGTTLLNSPGRYDVFVAKLNSSGALVWAQDVPGTATDVDNGQAIAVDASGNVYTAGYFQDTATFGALVLTGSSSSNAFVAKQNAAGQFVWVASSTCANAASNAGAQGLALDALGNIEITGYFAGTVSFATSAGPVVLQAVGSRDAFVAQFNSSGNVNWAEGFGGSDVDQCNAITTDTAGNVYTTGFFAGSADFDPGAGTTQLSSGGDYSAFVQKLDSGGHFVWARALVISSGSAQGTAIVVDPSGTVDTAGWFDNTVDFDPGPGTANLTSAGFEDAFVSQLSASGNYVGALRGGGTNYDVALGLAVASTGTMVITGGYTAPATFGSTVLNAVGKVGGYVAALSPSVVLDPVAPGTPSLEAASDTGLSNSDGITSNTHPTFDITQADPADTVQLRRNGVIVASRTGPGALTDPGPLADGTYTYTATQQNAAGTSPASGSILLTIDTIPPAAPTAPGLLAADDSGTPGDGITNMTQPHFTGTTEAGALVQLLNASNTVFGTATASPTGAYSIQVTSPLTDGTYSVHVQAQDVAGNLSVVSPSISLKLDTAAPPIPAAPVLLASDDSGVVGDRITSVKQPHLTGTVEASATVQLLNTVGAVIGTTVASASGSYSVAPTSPLSDGSYSLSVRAIDAAGNASSQSPALTLTIDTTSPATPPAPMLLAADDSGVSGDLLTNVAQPHVTGTAEAGSSLQVLNALNAVVGTGTAAGNGWYTILLSGPLPQGANALRIQATDVAGNLSPASPAVTITVDTTAPSTPPAPVLLSADDSGTKGDGLTNTKQPHLTGTTEPRATVQLLNGSAVLNTVAAAGDGSYSLQPASPLADGAYRLTVQATDAAGSSSAVSPALNVTIDSTPPATPGAPVLLAADDSGAKGDGLTNVKQPHLTGTAEPGSTVQLSTTTGNPLGTATALSDGSYSVLVASPLADGLYTVRIQATDAAGNASAFSSTLILTIDTTPPAAPAPPGLLSGDDSGTKADGLTNVKQPHLTGQTEPAALVQLIDAAGTVLGSATADGTGAFSVAPASPLTDGPHALRVQSQDAAGNLGAASSAVTITIDSVPPLTPAAPTLLPADDTGVLGDGLTSNTQPHLAGSTEPNAQVQILNASGAVLGTGTAAGDGSYSVRFASVLAAGTYAVRVQASDAAGNTSAASLAFNLTIDTSGAPPAPAAPMLLATDDSGVFGDGITNIKQPHLTGTSIAGNTILLLNAGGTVIASGLIGSNGSYTVQVPSALADGTYSYTVEVRDTVGRLSPPSPALSLTIDTTPPATPAAPVLLATDDSGTRGDGLTNVKQPHLTGTTEPGATVQLLHGSTLLGTTTAAVDGTFSVLVSSALADGTYPLTVQATEAAGNASGVSAVFNLTIDTAAPATPPAPTLLAVDDSGTKTDGITNTKQPHLIGTAVPGATVQLTTVAGTLLGSATAATDGSYSIQVSSALTDGSYSLRVQATDAAGNPSAFSGSFNLTIDTTAPAMPVAPTLLLADDSGTKGDGITNIKQPHLMGSTEAGATVQLLNSTGTAIGTTTASNTGAYSVVPSSALADGSYTLSVRAIDLAGNPGASSPAVTLTIDSTPPATPAASGLLSADDSGARGDGLTNVKQPRLAGFAEPGATVQVSTVAGGLVAITTAATDGSYSVQTASPLPDGTYSLRVLATDAAGNPSAFSASFSLTIDTAPPATPTAPVLLGSDDSGTKSDGITNITQPRFTGTTEPGVTVQLLNGSAVLGTATAASDGSFTVQASSPLADGTYRLVLQATDLAGNTSAASAALSLTIDATPPATPTAPTLLAADDSGIPGDGITNIRSPHLTGKTESGASVDLLSATGTVLATVTAAGDGSYSLTPPNPLAPGSVSFQVRARDAAGNTSAVSASLTLKIIAAASPGDYDGDGKTDIALARPSSSQWIIWRSASNTAQIVALGAPGDIPVSGDYDRVGHAEPAVYRPSTGQWIISGPSGIHSMSFGAPGDLPVAADYDGDGKTDFALYRPWTGQWIMIRSTAGPLVTAFGAPNLDRPIPADYDGDGKADLAVYRPTTGQWIMIRSTAGPQVVAFGAPGLDQPVPADYDGDGKADIALYRLSTGQWLMVRSTAGPQIVSFGAPNVDQPLTGDFDGDGMIDIAVFRPTTATWLIWRSTLGVQVTPFGWPGVDQAVPQPLYNELAGTMSTTSRGAGAIANTAAATPLSVLDPLPRKKTQAIDAVLAEWSGLNAN